MSQPLTEVELLKLRAFQRQFDRIRNSAIGKARNIRLTKSNHFDFTTGEIKPEFSGYDPELFQAVLPILRQFFLNDDIGFFQICNISFQKCDRVELKAWIAEARKRWQENLASLPTEVDRNLHLANSTLEQALKKVFYGYGGLFHVDIHAPEEQKAVETIETALLHQAFPRLCWCLNVVGSVIYWWLDAPDVEVPSVATGK